MCTSQFCILLTSHESHALSVYYAQNTTKSLFLPVIFLICCYLRKDKYHRQYAISQGGLGGLHFKALIGIKCPMSHNGIGLGQFHVNMTLWTKNYN